MKYILIILTLAIVSGCGSKKIITKNCEKAENTDLYICEKI